MKRSIAITGGIGSGKSTLLRILKDLGFLVFSCDEIYSEIVKEPEYINKIAEKFPNAVTDNRLDKTKLGEIVFGNKCAREQLNQIAHPLIMERLLKLIKEAEADIVFSEVPLLFEGGFENCFDEIIILKRDLKKRIESVCVRDGISSRAIEDRIASQIDYNDENLKKYINNKKTYVIFNNDDVNQLKDIIVKHFL